VPCSYDILEDLDTSIQIQRSQSNDLSHILIVEAIIPTLIQVQPIGPERM
jgi:hypothetical protein